MIDNHIIITPTSLNNVGNSKEIMIPRFGSKEDIINVKNPETAFSDNKKIDVKIGLKSETWDQRKQDDKEGKILCSIFLKQSNLPQSNTNIHNYREYDIPKHVDSKIHKRMRNPRTSNN